MVAWTERKRTSRYCRRQGKSPTVSTRRGNERRLVIVAESRKTEDVLQARDEGGLSGEGDDIGVWRGEEDEGTTEKKVGGDNVGNGDGPGGAERSGEESECVEDADYVCRQDSTNRQHKVTQKQLHLHLLVKFSSDQNSMLRRTVDQHADMKRK